MSEFAVLGDPISHSLSPAIFGLLFDKRGLTGMHYSAIQVAADKFSEQVDRIRTGTLSGASVTAPHKERARAAADEKSDDAKAIGAANCLVHKAGKVFASNTDVEGLRAALERHGIRLGGRRVLILGAGGAARAAAHLSKREGAATVTVANRTPAKAEAMLKDLGLGWGRVYPLDGRGLDAAEVIIQATSAGLPGTEPLPLEPFKFRRGQTVLDMIYRPLQTPLLAKAKADGARTVDGLWMLMFQAMEQFKQFGHGDPKELEAPLRAHLETLL